MQAELQTALFHAFDTLNLQQMKSFNVPPVTLHGVGALAACGPQAQSRGLRHLFVMVDSFLHQAGMTAGLERSLAMKGIAMTLWPCPAGEPCVTDICAAVAQLRDARCDGVVAFGGGSVLDAAKAVALLVANPEQTLGEMTEHSELRPRLPLIAVPTTAGTGSGNHQCDGDYRCGEWTQTGAGACLADAGCGDPRRRADRGRPAAYHGNDRD